MSVLYKLNYAKIKTRNNESSLISFSSFYGYKIKTKQIKKQKIMKKKGKISELTKWFKKSMNKQITKQMDTY